MTGYKITLDELAAAGKAASSLSAQLAAIDLSAGLRRVAEAMPGSRAAQVAASLAAAWKAQVDELGQRAGEHGEKLHEAREHYITNEEAAEADIRFDRTGQVRPV
ncbi:hypothetical protein SAMN05421810_111122 [Amycolatopsis arida]|uniref:Excreted virulence factor EspC, type VII ESX diderm n=1 Tax=Amycolatopsis arida TaxID=587909 RepID=A0A1I6A6T4_9PSEU|nr:hypothetical protein [Amycolatopsis arida]TDX88573.1 hypothetical protein CLV69_11191 [Amycolatopsis arida]SFQ64333.1 hypothetical protein SAMN05421810_111122 [Amycolatopsis arida]